MEFYKLTWCPYCVEYSVEANGKCPACEKEKQKEDEYEHLKRTVVYLVKLCESLKERVSELEKK